MVDEEDSGSAQAAAGPDAVYETAKGLFHQKKYEEAAAVCATAEREGRYDSSVVAVHSASLLKLRRAQDAMTLLESMLYYFPDDARLHLNLGSAYTATFRRQDARREYELAKRLDPEVVGRKVRRMMVMRVGVGAVSFAAFFVCFIFWPDTRWVLVGLIGLMMALVVWGMVVSAKAGAKERIRLYLVMMAGWTMILVVVILLPSHIW
jgi:tetratricopeptide (TPR) repeat protein